MPEKNAKQKTYEVPMVLNQTAPCTEDSIVSNHFYENLSNFLDFSNFIELE